MQGVEDVYFSNVLKKSTWKLRAVLIFLKAWEMEAVHLDSWERAQPLRYTLFYSWSAL